MPASKPEKPNATGRRNKAGKKGDSSPSRIGDQVMDMLQNVESQLQKLRALPRVSGVERIDLSAPGKNPNQIAALQSQITALEEALLEANSRDEEHEQKQEAINRQIEEKQVELDSARSMIVQLQSQASNASPEEFSRMKDRVAEIEGQLEERDQEIKNQQTQLEQAAEKLTAFSEAINEQFEITKQGAANADLVQDQKTAMDRLKRELEEARDAARQDAPEQAKVEEYEQQLAAQDRELESLRAEVGQLRSAESGGGDSDVTNSLRDRIAELEASLEERTDSAQMGALQEKMDHLETELGEARQQVQGNDPGVMGDLREKAQRIQAVAEHLRQRRSRLKRMRALLQGGTPSTGNVMADLEKRSSQMRKIEHRHRELIELKSNLEAAERKMIRRWGRAKSGALVGWGLILAIIVAGISWFAADIYFPATITASVKVSAKSHSTSPLTEKEAASWRNWHQNLLSEPSFHETLARRMRDRRLEQFDTASAVAARLNNQLAIDHAQPGAMVLTLSGKDKEETLTILDVVASTLAKESSRQLGSREGRVWATVRSAGKSGRHLRFASLNPLLLKDEREIWAAVIFGFAYFACVGLILFVYTKLVRAKRIFEDEEEEMLASAEAGTIT